MAENVTAIFGGPTGLPEPNATCIEALREWLAMAEAGEIVGVAIAGLCADHMSRYAVAGKVGGYGLIGAVEMAKADLLEVVRDG